MNKYDLVIVGFGAIGASSAWHVARRNPGWRILIVDPHPERGSSLRGTGGIRAQFGSEINIAMSLESIEAMKRFPEEVGFDIDLRQRGYLLFTAEDRTAEAMRAAVARQNALGVPSRILNREQIRDRAPFLRTEDLVAGAFCPIDGTFEGPSIRNGYASAAERLGVETMRAKALGWSKGRMAIEGGSVEAEQCVLATGHWSGRSGIDFGLSLPVTPEAHQLFERATCPAVPRDAPMVLDLDTSFHFRPYRDGLLMGCRAMPNPPIDAGEIPEFRPEFFEILERDGGRRFPTGFASDEPVRGRAGFYSVTPDRHAIVDRRGDLVVATGFCGHGVMHSPAAGRMVADLVMGGSPSRELRLNRFGASETTEAMVF